MRQKQINGVSALLLLAGMAWFFTGMVHPTAQRFWVQVMVGLAAFEGVSGFLALSLAMRRSNRLFFSIFGGGILIRLILLALAAWVLHRWSSFVTLPLLSLVLVSFLASLIQLPFLMEKT